MSRKELILTGDNLSIEKISQFVNDIPSEAKDDVNITVKFGDHVFKTVEAHRQFVDESITNHVIYGVNTGFGPMASIMIGQNDLEALQKNLILSHAVGMGDPIKNEYVLAGMLVRLNTLSKGYSGVTTDLLAQLQDLVNHRVIPIIPEHGAVGTSGDLVQLAHIGLSVIGEGQAYYKGTIKPIKEIFSETKLQPYTLKAKEGLSLINGTSIMTGIGAVLCSRAANLLKLATRLGALSLEIVGAFEDGISERLHAVRPQSGQQAIAEEMRKYLSSSRLLRKRSFINQFSDKVPNGESTHEIPESVQEVYSLRCIPQVLGPALETLEHASNIIEVEMNSVSDNPIVDLENKTFLHGGNFHGDAVAVVIDQLKASMIKLTMLSERRINFFLNHKTNQHFPPFLNLNKPGLSLALQGLQFVATSTTAQSQSFGYPHNLHSIPTNGDNQDIVSMGTDAALLCAKVLDNSSIVLAIELITLSQAVEFTKEFSNLSESSRSILLDLRKLFPVVTGDHNLELKLKKVAHFINEFEF